MGFKDFIESKDTKGKGGKAMVIIPSPLIFLFRMFFHLNFDQNLHIKTSDAYLIIFINIIAVCKHTTTNYV